MRDVTAALPGKLDAARYRPTPRLAKPVERRVKDNGFGELRDARTGAWSLLHPMLVATHDVLDEGGTLDDMIARALPVSAKPDNQRFTERVVRDYLWQLHRAGIVDIPLEAPPDVFAGRYRRLRELGRGGMGVVHACEDVERGGEVVVKHAWGWTTEISRADRSVRREAEALGAVDHAAFPQILATFERDGLMHLVREKIDGRPLDARGAVRDDAGSRRGIVAALADALHHLHLRGFVYLDVKPSNFLATDEGVRVLDLGTARRMTAGGVTMRRPIGSPGYAAPEVRRALRATPACDQYGLGRLYHFLGAGRRPSRTWDEAAFAAALATTTLEPREQAVARRMAADDPSARFPDLEAAREALLA